MIDTDSDMAIIDLFLTQTRKHPKRSAVIFNNKSYSYEDFCELVRRLCGLLNQRGFKLGDHCIVSLHNSIEFAALLLAAADLGIVIAPIDTSLPVSGIHTAIKSTDAKFLITQPSVLKNYRSHPGYYKQLSPHNCLAFGHPFLPENDLNQIFETNISCDYRLGEQIKLRHLDYILTMTSGSTGHPKPIVLTQNTKIHRSFDGAKTLYDLSDQEVIIAASPMYHSLAQRLVLLPLMTGGTSVILAKFSTQAWLQAVEAHKVTFTLAVSNHLEQLLMTMENKRYDISSLKILVSSSSLLREEIKAKCIKIFQCDFHECYGTSEVGIVTNLSPHDNRTHLATVGKALPYVNLKIVNRQKEKVKVGEIGEITCQTTTAFSRYYKRPEATAKSIINDYFYTGDLGYLDENGFLYLSGRTTDTIIVSGTNVYPNDIEEVISKIDSINEVSVIGIEDAYFGEVILAIIVTKPDHDFSLREVKKMCMQNLADFQQPIAYEVVEFLPKNALGKIMKHELKKQFIGYDATNHFRTMLTKK